MTRRQLLQALAASPAAVTASRATTQSARNTDVAYGETTLPEGVRSRFVNGVNGTLA